VLTRAGKTEKVQKNPVKPEQENSLNSEGSMADYYHKVGHLQLAH
jgi:hypothetical protein